MIESTHENDDLHLGYLFHYPHIGEPEPFRLDIFIVDTPTEEHYDPHKVDLLVVSDHKDIIVEHLKILHPWNSSQQYRVCPGVIRMVDRKNKVEEALTFGGNLTIYPETDSTLLKITSNAPIIKITNTTNMNEILRDEIEILWAERKAHWLSYPDEYEHRLVSVDPLVLYQASLNALIEKYENLRRVDPKGNEVLHHLKTLLARVKSAGFRMAPKPQIEDAL